MLSSMVLEMTPNAMPSAPSTSCAAKPIRTKGRSSTIVALVTSIKTPLRRPARPSPSYLHSGAPNRCKRPSCGGLERQIELVNRSVSHSKTVGGGKCGAIPRADVRGRICSEGNRCNVGYRLLTVRRVPRSKPWPGGGRLGAPAGVGRRRQHQAGLSDSQDQRGGAVLHADLPIEEGRRLELKLDTGEHLDGSIAWRRGSGSVCVSTSRSTS